LRFLRETGVLINLFQLLNKGSSNLDLLCHLIIKKKRIIFINHAHENTFVLA
jgi:selenocysteine lyase/cysteine desulfurase